MFFEKLKGVYKWERYFIWLHISLFMHLNQLLTEKMQSDREFRHHNIDPNIEYMQYCNNSTHA